MTKSDRNQGWVRMSPAGTADVIPYLRFEGCRRFRAIFDAYRREEG